VEQHRQKQETVPLDLVGNHETEALHAPEAREGTHDVGAQERTEDKSLASALVISRLVRLEIGSLQTLKFVKGLVGEECTQMQKSIPERKQVYEQLPFYA
jgi:hypothetical protein